MNLKYWFDLLTEWRKLGRDGFTIPFIIVSQKYLPAQSMHQDIHELFIDIVQTSPEPICIKFCLTTDDIILEILDERKQLRGRFPAYNGVNQTCLFLTSFLDDLGADCEQVIASLSDKYQHYIDNNEFSLNNRERGDYTEEEKMFIKSVYGT